MIHDPEVPAGYQDADLEQAEYERQSAEAAELNRRGICTHSMLIGKGHSYTVDEVEGERKRCGKFPDRPTSDPTVIPDGSCLCLDCGQYVPDPFDRR